MLRAASEKPLPSNLQGAQPLLFSHPTIFAIAVYVPHRALIDAVCTALRAGLKIALADVLEDVLAEAGREVAAIVGDGNVLVIPTDVSKIGDVQRLRDKVYEAWGEVSCFR